MNERIIRVYADTSVYGGAFDDEFRRPSNRFFEQVRSGRFWLVSSPLVEQELLPAPDQVRELFRSLLELMEQVEISTQAQRLQQAYVQLGVAGTKQLGDALHVALATVAECEMIVSWNFGDIVHFDKIRRYNAINELNGYSRIGIFSPYEVFRHEGQDI
jgi:hypothetical protein